MGDGKNIMVIVFSAATNHKLVIFAMQHQHMVQLFSGFHAVKNQGYKM